MIFTKKQTGLRRLATLAVLAASLLGGQAAFAQNKAAIRVKEVIQIEQNGDSKFQIDMKLQIGPYTNLKKNNPNTALLMRNLGLGNQGWQEIKEVKGEWLDGESTVKIQYKCRGMCRMSKDMSWEVPVAEEADLELSDMHDNIATLTGATDSPLGIIASTTRLILPGTAKDIRLLKSPARVAFRLPSHTGGSKTSVSFDLESKPQMMSSLAKAHSNPKFSNMWVAKSRLENTGDQCLTNFKVRFRVVDYTSAWSQWNVVPQVVPGQVVNDAYFPVMDSDKVAKLNSSAQVMVEAQYQYKTADGKLVEDSETKQVELLGRNNVFYSSLKEEERVGWHDLFNLGPAILASFVTHEDPIMQQIAGWISGQADGAASAYSDQEALKFLTAAYDFMTANKIAYQSPPGHLKDGQVCQNVKYGRDVLRNRAGTCIDLAILWGSITKAVGLKPVLFLIPGHCFPAVKLPSGKLLAIESTMVGKANFEAAVKRGMEEMLKCLDGVTPNHQVDIELLQTQGLAALELPTLPVDTLEKWGIKPVTYTKPQQQQPQAPANRGGAQRQVGKLVGGVWTTMLNGQNGSKVLQALGFTDNGECLWMIKPEGDEAVTKKGTYTYDGDTVKLMIEGNAFGARIEWKDNDHMTWIETEAQHEFTRQLQQSNNNGGGNRTVNNTPAQHKLAGGVWRTVMIDDNGGKIYQGFTMGEDGSFVSSFENEQGQKAEIRGSYTYQNGNITITVNGNTERATITWIDANKMIYSRDGNKVEYTRSAQ
jgi:hypothetical protein